MEYLKNHGTGNLVVVFGITDLSRFELPVPDKDINHVYSMSTIGPWKTSKDLSQDTSDLTFFITLYGKFHHTNYETESINKRLLHLHCFLDRLNIEHYFVELHCHGSSILNNQFGMNLPLICFKDKNGEPVNAIRYAIEQGYQFDYAGHFDHDTHEFLAELFYNHIKDI